MEDKSMNALSYNTERQQLHIPEYGRNVQNMIEHAKRIDSRDERNKAVRAIIDVMGQLNPHLRDVEDYTHKLWTHLYIMSDFEIDVDSPYPIPEQEKLRERPKEMKYPKLHSKYGHFGYYTEEMIRTVSKDAKDEDERKYMTLLLANLLKKNYLTYHTENVENGAIASHLKELSKGKLIVEDPEKLTPTPVVLKQHGIVKNSPKFKKRKGSKKRRK